MSGYRRIQTGGSDRVVTSALHAGDPASPLTGLTSVVLSIWRINGSSVEWYDFNDSTFKTVGWTTLQRVMTELDATRSPGVYQYLWATASITNPNTDDSYFYRVTDTSLRASNTPQEGMLDVGQYPDKLDATVSSRATQAQILSDATPFPGANIWSDDEKKDIRGALGVTGTKTVPTGGQLQTVVSDTADIRSRIANIEIDMTLVKNFVEGGWEIVGNQMIFTTKAGVEFMRFDLLGSSGDPSMTDVYKRVPV